MKTLTEGKTKVIYGAGESTVLIRSKDDITSGDGARRDVIEGKGAVSTRTTANVFRTLNRSGIPTHFLKQVDETGLLCLRCEMIALEVTIRGTAAGHWLKRHPEATEGTDFEDLVVDFTLKDDARHDPVVITSEEGPWKLYESSQPVGSHSALGTVNPMLSPEEVDTVSRIGRRVFRTLKGMWRRLDVKLVDLKIEVGRTADGRIVVADVIDNDSWRLWPGGEKAKQLDKQIYRDCGNLEDIVTNYQRVAEMTDLFDSE
jgi:phosphoribosylaminoimidazole-succinocarboxamide synthase